VSTSSAIAGLQATAAALRERLASLQRTAGDLPDPEETVVVDLVRDACDDVDGWLTGLVASAATAQTAARQRRSAAVAGALCESTGAYEQALQSFVTGLGGVDSLSRLRQFGADRPGSWETWAWTVQDGVAAAWTDLSAVRGELDRCWQELVEHLLHDPVVVQAQVMRDPQPAPDASPGGR
jgi:hypothetical protein